MVNNDLSEDVDSTADDQPEYTEPNSAPNGPQSAPTSKTPSPSPAYKTTQETSTVEVSEETKSTDDIKLVEIESIAGVDVKTEKSSTDADVIQVENVDSTVERSDEDGAEQLGEENNRLTSTSLYCSVPLNRDVLSIIDTFSKTEQDRAGKKSRKLLCLYCDRTFVAANLRQKHIDRCHSIKQARRSSSRIQQTQTATICLFCDKFTDTEHDLKELFQHQINEHSDKYFGCYACEERFLTQPGLDEHNEDLHDLKLEVISDDKNVQSVDEDNDLINEGAMEYSVNKNKHKSKIKEDDALVETQAIKTTNTRRTRQQVQQELRSKRIAIKSTKLGIKRNTRITNKTNKNIGGGGKKKQPIKEKVTPPIETPIGLINTEIKANPEDNPYPTFDAFFRVKKITDHSIDNLRISSLTFNDVFDQAFYSRIKCNIRENLLNHLDGKLFNDEESESRISNFEKTQQEPTTTENYGCDLSLNAATPSVSSNLLSNQFGDDLESQIEYGSKASKKKPVVKKDEVHYKYFTRRKYQASILEGKENRDLSKLDMWTQFVIKTRQQKVINITKSDKEKLDYKKGDAYKAKKQNEELNRILDRRGPFEDLKEETTKKAALEGHFNQEANEDVSSILEDILGSVFNNCIEESGDELIVPKTELTDADIPDYLNLRKASFSNETPIDKSDKITLICASQETDNFEAPHISPRDKNAIVELSGEWARSRLYICAACGLKVPNLKLLLDHKSCVHQNVWCQHYEFVGNQGRFYKHLSIPGLGKMSYLDDNAICKVWRRSDARGCTKCKKQCNSLGELHRHVLECGEDWSWMMVRKKCKYRPFGAKTRKKRRGLFKRIINTNKEKDGVKRKYNLKSKIEGPRPKPSDAETIQRMLANLPAKRASRKIMSLKDGVPTKHINNTTQTQENKPNTNQNAQKNIQIRIRRSRADLLIQEGDKLLKRKVINARTGVKCNPVSNLRQSVRNLNKVISSKLIDTTNTILVKRKLKNVLRQQRITRRTQVDVKETKEENIDEIVEEAKDEVIPKITNKTTLLKKVQNLRKSFSRKKNKTAAIVEASIETIEDVQTNEVPINKTIAIIEETPIETHKEDPPMNKAKKTKELIFGAVKPNSVKLVVPLRKTRSGTNLSSNDDFLVNAKEENSNQSSASLPESHSPLKKKVCKKSNLGSKIMRTLSLRKKKPTKTNESIVDSSKDLPINDTPLINHDLVGDESTVPEKIETKEDAENTKNNGKRKSRFGSLKNAVKKIRLTKKPSNLEEYRTQHTSKSITKIIGGHFLEDGCKENNTQTLIEPTFSDKLDSDNNKPKQISDNNLVVQNTITNTVNNSSPEFVETLSDDILIDSELSKISAAIALKAKKIDDTINSVVANIIQETLDVENCAKVINSTDTAVNLGLQSDENILLDSEVLDLSIKSDKSDLNSSIGSSIRSEGDSLKPKTDCSIDLKPTKLVKRTKGLSACIAMLTNKLVQKPDSGNGDSSFLSSNESLAISDYEKSIPPISNIDINETKSIEEMIIPDINIIQSPRKQIDEVGSTKFEETLEPAEGTEANKTQEFVMENASENSSNVNKSILLDTPVIEIHKEYDTLEQKSLLGTFISIGSSNIVDTIAKKVEDLNKIEESIDLNNLGNLRGRGRRKPKQKIGSLRKRAPRGGNMFPIVFEKNAQPEPPIKEISDILNEAILKDDNLEIVDNLVNGENNVIGLMPAASEDFNNPLDLEYLQNATRKIGKRRSVPNRKSKHNMELFTNIIKASMSGVKTAIIDKKEEIQTNINQLPKDLSTIIEETTLNNTNLTSNIFMVNQLPMQSVIKTSSQLMDDTISSVIGRGVSSIPDKYQETFNAVIAAGILTSNDDQNIIKPPAISKACSCVSNTSKDINHTHESSEVVNDLISSELIKPPQIIISPGHSQEIHKSGAPQEIFKSAEVPKELIKALEEPIELLRALNVPLEIIKALEVPIQLIKALEVPKELIKSVELIKSIELPKDLIKSVEKTKEMLEFVKSKPVELIIPRPKMSAALLQNIAEKEERRGLLETNLDDVMVGLEFCKNKPDINFEYTTNTNLKNKQIPQEFIEIKTLPEPNSIESINLPDNKNFKITIQKPTSDSDFVVKSTNLSTTETEPKVVNFKIRIQKDPETDEDEIPLKILALPKQDSLINKSNPVSESKETNNSENQLTSELPLIEHTPIQVPIKVAPNRKSSPRKPKKSIIGKPNNPLINNDIELEHKEIPVPKKGRRTARINYAENELNIKSTENRRRTSRINYAENTNELLDDKTSSSYIVDDIDLDIVKVAEEESQSDSVRDEPKIIEPKSIDLVDLRKADVEDPQTIAILDAKIIDIDQPETIEIVDKLITIVDVTTKPIEIVKPNVIEPKTIDIVDPKTIEIVEPETHMNILEHVILEPKLVAEVSKINEIVLLTLDDPKLNTSLEAKLIKETKINNLKENPLGEDITTNSMGQTMKTVKNKKGSPKKSKKSVKKAPTDILVNTNIILEHKDIPVSKKGKRRTNRMNYVDLNETPILETKNIFLELPKRGKRTSRINYAENETDEKMENINSASISIEVELDHIIEHKETPVVPKKNKRSSKNNNQFEVNSDLIGNISKSMENLENILDISIESKKGKRISAIKTTVPIIEDKLELIEQVTTSTIRDIEKNSTECKASTISCEDNIKTAQVIEIPISINNADSSDREITDIYNHKSSLVPKKGKRTTKINYIENKIEANNLDNMESSLVISNKRGKRTSRLNYAGDIKLNNEESTETKLSELENVDNILTDSSILFPVEIIVTELKKTKTSPINKGENISEENIEIAAIVETILSNQNTSNLDPVEMSLAEPIQSKIIIDKIATNSISDTLETKISPLIVPKKGKRASKINNKIEINKESIIENNISKKSDLNIVEAKRSSKNKEDVRKSNTEEIVKKSDLFDEIMGEFNHSNISTNVKNNDISNIDLLPETFEDSFEADIVKNTQILLEHKEIPKERVLNETLFDTSNDALDSVDIFAPKKEIRTSRIKYDEKYGKVTFEFINHSSESTVEPINKTKHFHVFEKADDLDIIDSDFSDIDIELGTHNELIIPLKPKLNEDIDFNEDTRLDNIMFGPRNDYIQTDEEMRSHEASEKAKRNEHAFDLLINEDKLFKSTSNFDLINVNNVCSDVGNSSLITSPRKSKRTTDVNHSDLKRRKLPNSRKSKTIQKINKVVELDLELSNPDHTEILEETDKLEIQNIKSNLELENEPDVLENKSFIENTFKILADDASKLVENTDSEDEVPLATLKKTTAPTVKDKIDFFEKAIVENQKLTNIDALSKSEEINDQIFEDFDAITRLDVKQMVKKGGKKGTKKETKNKIEEPILDIIDNPTVHELDPTNKVNIEKSLAIYDFNESTEDKEIINTEISDNSKENMEERHSPKRMKKVRGRKPKISLNNLNSSSELNYSDISQNESQQLNDAETFVTPLKDTKINEIQNDSFIKTPDLNDTLINNKINTHFKIKQGNNTKSKKVKAKKIDEVENVDTYCEICHKQFMRSENLVKHKRTLTHIAKLSEIEAKEAADKSKLQDKDVVVCEEDAKQINENHDDKDDCMLLEDDLQDFDAHGVDANDLEDDAQDNEYESHEFADSMLITSPFSLKTTKDTLKLADIINEVLNKPGDKNLEPFSDILVEQSQDTKRYKSLGERKSFDSDTIMYNSSKSNYTNHELINNKTADSILEKQISLLENIIEADKANFHYIDEISVSSNKSEQRCPSDMSLVSDIKQDDSNIISFSHNSNIVNGILHQKTNFVKPHQYEEISEDSLNIRNYEDQRSRKALNRDEALFLECCSLLKSSSEVSNFSKKSTRTIANNFDAKQEEPDWLERKNFSPKQTIFNSNEEFLSDNSCPNTPIGDNYDDFSDSNTIKTDWNTKIKQQQQQQFEDISIDSSNHSQTKNNFNNFNHDFNADKSQSDIDSKLSESNIVFNEDSNTSDFKKNIDAKFGGLMAEALKTQDLDDLNSNNSISICPTSSETTQTSITDYAIPISKKVDNYSDSQTNDSKKMLTKGAMKVFEGLKVSIPTDDIDMDQVLNCSPTSKRLELENDIKEDRIPKPKETQKKNNIKKFGNKLGLKITKKKQRIKRSPNKTKKMNLESKNKIMDVYDFEETQDNSDLFVNSNLRPIKNHISIIEDKEDSLEDPSLDDLVAIQNDLDTDKDDVSISEKTDIPDIESDSESHNPLIESFNFEAQSLSSFSTETESSTSLKKTSSLKNITKKKCVIMGRIFKNAFKSKVEDKKEEIVQEIVKPVKALEIFDPIRPKPAVVVVEEPARSKMSVKEMDILFDKLLEEATPKKVEEEIEIEATIPINTKTSVLEIDKPLKIKPKSAGKPKKRQRKPSQSSDDEFNLIKAPKKRIVRKKAKDNEINLEQEFKECIGVAGRKTQRKCTSGKQNVLVEYWSSDDSEFEAFLNETLPPIQINQKETKQIIHKNQELQQDIIDAPIKEQKIEEPHDIIKESEINPEFLKEIVKDAQDANNKPRKKSVIKPHKNPNKIKTKYSADTLTANRRKRAAADTLYYWSSSSDDESGNLIEVKPVRDDAEDDEDRPMQHGWIVGDSPKKLVTMLAQAKGKKTDTKSVKEQGKKRTTI